MSEPTPSQPFPLTDRPAAFILTQTLVWYLMIVIAKPFLDKYGDMVEVYAWSQHFLMGSNKHPQFLPWMAHLWFAVMPRTVASFYALAAINLGVAFAGIYALGRALGLSRGVALAAVALEALAFPYLTLADKLNMNAILLPTWPWTAWAFARALNGETGRQRLIGGVLFGLMAAIAMMSKYYSALLLATLLIATLLPGTRKVWSGIAPWAGLAAFALAIAPHLAWQIHHHFETFTYAEDQGTGFDGYHFLTFVLLPIYYWILPWPAALILFYRGPFLARVTRSLRMQGKGDVLWLMAFGPYLMSLFAGIVGFVFLSEPWGIPIGFAFTLLWLRNADEDRIAAASARLMGAFRYIWPAMILLGAVFAFGAGRNGDRAFYYPERQAALKIGAEWQRIAPGQRLYWVASGNDAARVAYFARLPQRVEALPGLPDALPDYYPPVKDWQAKAGLIICPLGAGTDIAKEDDCTRVAEHWSTVNGHAIHDFRFAVARKGFTFPRHEPFAFAAFFYIPPK